MLNTLKSDDLSIRPMLGRMKKSLFDIIRTKLQGIEFLDMFAGTGAVGLEALSNGARRVVFIEQSPVSLKLIKENLDMLGYGARGVIANRVVERLVEHFLAPLHQARGVHAVERRVEFNV